MDFSRIVLSRFPALTPSHGFLPLYFMSKIKGFSPCCLPQRQYRGQKYVTRSSLLLDSQTLDLDKLTPVGSTAPSAFHTPTTTSTGPLLSLCGWLGRRSEELVVNTAGKGVMRVPTPASAHTLPAWPNSWWPTSPAVSPPASTTKWYSCCHSWAKEDLPLKKKKKSENTFPAL